MFGIGHGPEIIILLIVVLLVFGPGKLPEVGSAIGRGIREFKDATSGRYDQPTPTITHTAPPPSIQPPTQQWTAPISEQREPVEAARTHTDQ